MKPFEIAVKKGGATGAMASFNKIGATWAGSNQAMIDGIMRTEWGFKGTIVTDYDDGGDSNMKLRAGIRGGLNLQLNPLYGEAKTNGRLDTSDITDMNLARERKVDSLYGMQRVLVCEERRRKRRVFDHYRRSEGKPTGIPLVDIGSRVHQYNFVRLVDLVGAYVLLAAQKESGARCGRCERRNAVERYSRA